MKYTYYYQKNHFGSEVTDNEAERAAEILMELAHNRFPEVEFEAEYGHGNDGLDVDDESLQESIQYWIQDHWADSLESPNMEWDLRAIHEDNAGGLWAEYGNGQLAEILNQDGNSPEDIATSDWFGHSTCQILDSVSAVDVISHPETKKLWSQPDGWADPEEITPGNAGSEYIARFCNDREVLISLSDLGAVEDVEYFGETYQVWRAGSLWTADPTTFDSHCYQGQFLGFHSSKDEALNDLYAWAQENAEKLAEV